NIIGFPNDTEESIREHVRTIKAMGTDVATFYILTTIPGTEQYDEFMAAGLVNEPNLDRFDSFYSVWRHPRLSPARLRELLFECYQDFYKDIEVPAELISRLGRAS